MQEYFSDNQIEEMVYRLGNMTLLEPNLNRQIGNKNYTLKKEIYQQSNYQLTKNIQAEEWNPESLHRRQIQLTKKAIQIRRSSFL
ncbi:RloF [Geminocystis sp. NIES-3709]|nr:RloF [Geminocystis sp. NIES-3709]